MKLTDIARVIRSKNAGLTTLKLDLPFSNPLEPLFPVRCEDL